MSIGAYVINLDKEYEKYGSTVQQVKKLGFPIERIRGVDGKSLSPQQKQGITTPFCNDYCTLSVIGCAASHLKALNTFLASRNSLAVICEDDVMLVDDCKMKLMEALAELPDSFDMLFCGCYDCDPSGKRTYSSSMVQLINKGAIGKERALPYGKNIYVPKMAFGTHCYVISRKGATKVVNILEKGIDFHVDVQINRHFRELQVFAMYSQIAAQNRTFQTHNVSAYPILPNTIAQHWKQGSDTGTYGGSHTYQYAFSVGGYQFLGIHLNTWFAISIMLSLLFGYMGRKDLFLCMILLITVPDIIQGSIHGHWNVPIFAMIIYASMRYIAKNFLSAQ